MKQNTCDIYICSLFVHVPNDLRPMFVFSVFSFYSKFLILCPIVPFYRLVVCPTGGGIAELMQAYCGCLT